MAGEWKARIALAPKAKFRALAPLMGLPPVVHRRADRKPVPGPDAGGGDDPFAQAFPIQRVNAGAPVAGGFPQPDNQSGASQDARLNAYETSSPPFVLDDHLAAQMSSMIGGSYAREWAGLMLNLKTFPPLVTVQTNPWLRIPWTLPCGGRWTEKVTTRFSYPIIDERKVVESVVAEVNARVTGAALVPDSVIEELAYRQGLIALKRNALEGKIDFQVKKECDWFAEQGCHYQFCLGGKNCMWKVLRCEIIGLPVEVEKDRLIASAPMDVPGVDDEFVWGWGKRVMEVTYRCECK